jgi:RNA polymerase sigma factor (sigma-70 family)
MNVSVADDLIDRIRLGDHKALEQFLNKHQSLVKTWIDKKVGVKLAPIAVASGVVKEASRSLLEPTDRHNGRTPDELLANFELVIFGNLSNWLISRIKAGDSDALDHWIKENRDVMKTWTERRFGATPARVADASDVVQDALLYLFQHVREFRGTTENEFRSWVHTMLHHKVIDIARATVREKNLRQFGQSPTTDSQRSEQSVLDNVAAVQSSASSRLSRTDKEKRILEASDKLTSDQLLLVLLKEVDGCSLKSIAACLGWQPVETAKVFYQAINELRGEFIDVDPRETPLRRAVAMLPARQREAVELKHVENWSLEEIAQVLDCTAQAVGALIYRGMEALREQLQ